MTLFGKVLTFWEIHVILTPVIALQKPARPATGGAPAGAPLFHYQTTHVTEDELLRRMGFPVNWKYITRYKK